MPFDQDLYAFLSTDTTVLAALGGVNSVYKSMVPKGKPFPAVVMQTIYFWPTYAAEGTLNAFKQRVQFDSYASTATAAAAISDVLQNLLANLSGSLGNTVVTASFVTRMNDMGYESGPTDGFLFRRLLWLEFMYYELATPEPASPTLPAPGNLDNAGYFQGVPVSQTPPTDGQVLVYSATDQRYEPEAVSGGSGGTPTDIDGGSF
jgi:hypothetical protein